MGTIVLKDNPDTEVLIRRSGRARRLSLRVSRLDGRVTLTLPKGVSEREGQRFLTSKADWIEKARAEATPGVRVAIGVDLPIEGRPRRIVEGSGRVPVLEHATLSAPARATGPVLRAWCVERARRRAIVLCDGFGERLGRPPARVTLRDTRSRWGSCSAAGTVMLSWRLIFAPSEVFDYVAAHEVAHLREMNHGPDFWATVETLMPEYRAPRRWLRTHGASLHSYRFD